MSAPPEILELAMKSLPHGPEFLDVTRPGERIGLRGGGGDILFEIRQRTVEKLFPKARIDASHAVASEPWRHRLTNPLPICCGEAGKETVLRSHKIGGRA